MKLKKLVIIPALLFLMSINFSCGWTTTCTFINSSTDTVSIDFPELGTLELLIDQTVDHECSMSHTFTFTSKVPVRIVETYDSYEFVYDLSGLTTGDQSDAEYASSDSTSDDTSSGAVRCRAYTQAGTRCKRMTTNRSGYCWQHD